ncbi:NnrU family protein, required for expression of nitric oxide and nitrite reductases (Nir and Nor) [hydrothermal vent metagenome]|uniref:NnrU family protein, required for expression of nitric oxide and nitrite reductases (Nir and Nor) n=1 Tax=hydrothermal vent metagenome TaxID=652676 RepID=A0A3B1AUQ1_9ZZZZ
MEFLVAGIALFFLMHMVPSFVGIRRKLIVSIGDTPYKGLLSVVSFAALILIIYGKYIAGFQSVWAPPAWSSKVTIVLMVLSFIFLAASGMKTNLNRITRHPMLWGVTFWSVAHLSTNGDLASILLFGSFGVFSLIAMLSANLRGAKKQKTKQPIILDVLVLIVGLLGYVTLVFLHPYLFGVSVV